MASFVPTDAGTLDDQRRYTADRLTEVACLDCLAVVGVKKNSEHHTQVQWSATARAACPELGRIDAAGPAGRTVHHGCPRLAASIDAATREGRIDVGAHDGY